MVAETSHVLSMRLKETACRICVQFVNLGYQAFGGVDIDLAWEDVEDR
jgi:hypothetical protein